MKIHPGYIHCLW